MKTLLLVVGLVVGLASSADAAERDKLQRAVGGFQTADAVVIGSSQNMTGVDIDCGGTACTASLYDGTATGDMTNANGRFEISAAANGTTHIDLMDAPIRFLNGIVLNVDANVDAVVVYTEQATP